MHRRSRWLILPVRKLGVRAMPCWVLLQWWHGSSGGVQCHDGDVLRAVVGIKFTRLLPVRKFLCRREQRAGTMLWRSRHVLQHRRVAPGPVRGDNYMCWWQRDPHGMWRRYILQWWERGFEALRECTTGMVLPRKLAV